MKFNFALITLLAFLISNQSYALAANKIDHLVVFGDSLSDAGYMDNLPALGKKNPAIDPNPNKQPTFTTPGGKVWPQYLSQLLLHKVIVTNNLSPLVTGTDAYASGTKNGYDYAAGGAVTSGEGVSRSAANYSPPSLAQQVAAYIQQHSGVSANNKTTQVDSDSLYIICDGADNFLQDTKVYQKAPLKLLIAIKNTAVQAPQQILQQVKLLQSEGAQHIIVIGMPDLGKTPLDAGGNKLVAAYLTAEAKKFNQNLQQDIAINNQQNLSNNPNATQVMYYDVFNKMDGYIEQPDQNPITINGKQYHFTNVTQPACPPLAPNSHSSTKQLPDALTCVPPQQNSFNSKNHPLFLFEDMAHPTTYAHLAVATDLYNKILNNTNL